MLEKTLVLCLVVLDAIEAQVVRGSCVVRLRGAAAERKDLFAARQRFRLANAIASVNDTVESNKV